LKLRIKKTNFLFFLLFLFTSSSFGQIKFERGYFIDNDNTKTECLIKNNDWKNNPAEFQYKLSENDDSKTGDVKGVKEFGIFGYSKYVRFNTEIDRSSEEVNNLTYIKDPIWSKEQLFLKILIGGKASLYSYVDGNLQRFFYSTNDSFAKQLIYKQYLQGDDEIATNFKFRQQLWVDVKCSTTKKTIIESIDYRQKELEKYFKNYNECLGDTVVVPYTKKSRNLFNLKISPGINYSSLTVKGSSFKNSSTVFSNTYNFRIGLEAEYILPINMNKWGIMIEPTYQTFHSESKTDFEHWTVNYNYFELPIGVRYYFFLNKNLKIFLNAFYIPYFGLNSHSTIDINNSPYLIIKSQEDLAIGGGIEYKRISAEIRYYTSQEILSGYFSWSSDYRKLSFIIGFKLFNTKQK